MACAYNTNRTPEFFSTLLEQIHSHLKSEVPRVKISQEERGKKKRINLKMSGKSSEGVKAKECKLYSPRNVSIAEQCMN